MQVDFGVLEEVGVSAVRCRVRAEPRKCRPRRFLHDVPELARERQRGRTRHPRRFDEQDIAALIKHTLERSGDAQVDLAYSGDTALRAVRDLSPDVVILDLNLPVMSGVDVCRLLRARPETADVGIIILTARTGEADRVGSPSWVVGEIVSPWNKAASGSGAGWSTPTGRSAGGPAWWRWATP